MWGNSCGERQRSACERHLHLLAAAGGEERRPVRLRRLKIERTTAQAASPSLAQGFPQPPAHLPHLLNLWLYQLALNSAPLAEGKQRDSAWVCPLGVRQPWPGGGRRDSTPGQSPAPHVALDSRASGREGEVQRERELCQQSHRWGLPIPSVAPTASQLIGATRWRRWPSSPTGRAPRGCRCS